MTTPTQAQAVPETRLPARRDAAQARVLARVLALAQELAQARERERERELARAQDWVLAPELEPGALVLVPPGAVARAPAVAVQVSRARASVARA